MKHTIEELTDKRGFAFSHDRPVVGLDIGSRASKGVLLTRDELHTVLAPTGLFTQETADGLLAQLLRDSGLKRGDIGCIVSTGYGRISLAFDDIPFEVVTEISCHAMGAHALHPAARTVIDIGGQDSKAIRLDTATGKVIDFVMNDKCAAGTGQFLEKAAALLGLNLEQLGRVALEATSPATISSQCVVFAESEMISLRARGARRNDGATVADIAAGVHYSAARRVCNLLGRVGTEPELLFTGGVSNNPGMRHVLEELIGERFARLEFDMIHAGALGAAVFAASHAARRTAETGAGPGRNETDGREIPKLIERAKSEFMDIGGGRKKVGHICGYTPLELLNASGVKHMRLFRAGNPDTVAAGELFTQSVFCDFTKSCIGAFQTGDPLYRALDRLYNFHTCTSMKHTSEVLERFAPVKLFNLPKLRDRPASRDFFRSEIIRFRDDLAELTGKGITEEAVRKQIVLYNRARSLIRNISELRKRPDPPLTGREFLDIAAGYFWLPPERLLEVYGELYARLSAVPRRGGKGLRLMMAGSIVGEGDRRLLDIVEGELGLRVVVEDHCAGVKPFYHGIDEEEDPFTALADGYLRQAPCARMKPLADSLDFSGHLAREYNVDGVLYVYLKFCSCYGVSKKAFTDHFRKLDLPVLEISGDYSGSDHGQLKTRMEAFVELLNAKRSATICTDSKI